MVILEYKTFGVSKILQTRRLILRKLTVKDAPFILQLLNTESFKKYVGDRKIYNLDAAENYILNGVLRSYTDNGFGLWLFQLKTDMTAIGICGLIKREGLQDIDIGFAMLPEFEKNGYAFEIASATLKYGHRKLGIGRIVAITTKDNKQSIKLLVKIGLQYERDTHLPNDVTPLMLFGNWKTVGASDLLIK